MGANKDEIFKIASEATLRGSKKVVVDHFRVFTPLRTLTMGRIRIQVTKDIWPKCGWMHWRVLHWLNDSIADMGEMSHCR
jgi:hypothetical protein